MCNFLSGITLQNGDVIISKNTDSHHEILSEFKISDKEIPPNFCAWEFTPPFENERYNYAVDIKKWSFNVDDQFPKPEWWDKGIEKLTIDECKKRVNDFLIKTYTDKIESGRWIILGGTVKSILGGTVKSIEGGTVESIEGGTVEYIRGGTVKSILGGTVEYIRGGTVESIRGGTVESILGGTVKSILGGTVTVYCKHNYKPQNDAIIIDKSGYNVIFITAKNKFEDK
jgi:hypothetical protein